MPEIKLTKLQQAEIRAAEATAMARAMHSELCTVMSWLESDAKFQGADPDGELRDWIGTRDMIAKLREVRDAGWAASDAARGAETAKAHEAVEAAELATLARRMTRQASRRAKFERQFA